MPRNRIIISAKVSVVQDLIAVYRDLSRCDYALHLGLTEAGMGTKELSLLRRMGILLQEGIGDTFRSRDPEPGNGTRKSPWRRNCYKPWGCGLSFHWSLPVRVASARHQLSQELAQGIQDHIRERMPEWREQYSGVEKLKVAVMGCIVNGPGESKHANIGIRLPGTGEEPAAPVFIDGEKKMTLRGPGIADRFRDLVEDYVQKSYAAKASER